MSRREPPTSIRDQALALRRRRRRTVAALAATAAAAVLLAIVAAAFAACGGGHPPAPAAALAAVTAELATAERIDLPRRVELYGTVEAERTVAVSTRVMAVVIAIHAQVGDAVRRGQLLAEIDL